MRSALLALRRLQRLFFTGLFILAPFGLTFMLLAWLVAFIERLLAPLTGLMGRAAPGLGIITAIAIVLGAGALASNMVGQHLLDFVEEMMLRIPIFNWLYKTIKQMAEIFSPSGKNSFKSVVLVEYPRPGVYSVGFLTNEVSLEEGTAAQALVCVYVPTNHMYIGDYILVPKDKVLATPLTLQEGIQATLSAGASLPPLLKAKRTP